MSYSRRTGTGGLGRTSVACSSESGADKTPVMAARNSRAADHDFWGIDPPSSPRPLCETVELDNLYSILRSIPRFCLPSPSFAIVSALTFLALSWRISWSDRQTSGIRMNFNVHRPSKMVRSHLPYGSVAPVGHPSQHLTAEHRIKEQPGVVGDNWAQSSKVTDCNLKSYLSYNLCTNTCSV